MSHKIRNPAMSTPGSGKNDRLSGTISSRFSEHKAPTQACKHCGKPLPRRKRGRPQQFCSDRCRKAEGRSDGLDSYRVLADEIIDRGFAGKIWPVFAWDDSPAIYGLIFPRRFVIDEINTDREEPITDRELVAALRANGIADYYEQREARLIRDFHQTRKARRAERKEASKVSGNGGRVE